MKKTTLLLAGAASLALFATAAHTQQAKAPAVDPAKVAAAIDAAWKGQTPEWLARVAQDETMEICSKTRNNPSKEQAAKIMASAKAAIVYPPDGQYLGDWKKGEKLALDGYGQRFTDTTPGKPNGGNCYACHQLSPTEISYGTLGPSLKGYGKTQGFTPEAAKAVYERVYNPQSVLACSNMPRLGHNKFLSIEQIKDAVAFLMSPDSPVNK